MLWILLLGPQIRMMHPSPWWLLPWFPWSVMENVDLWISCLPSSPPFPRQVSWFSHSGRWEDTIWSENVLIWNKFHLSTQPLRANRSVSAVVCPSLHEVLLPRIDFRNCDPPSDRGNWLWMFDGTHSDGTRPFLSRSTLFHHFTLHMSPNSPVPTVTDWITDSMIDSLRTLFLAVDTHQVTWGWMSRLLVGKILHVEVQTCFTYCTF